MPLMASSRICRRLRTTIRLKTALALQQYFLGNRHLARKFLPQALRFSTAVSSADSGEWPAVVQDELVRAFSLIARNNDTV